MTPSEILSQLISIPSVNPMGRDVDGEIYFEGRLSNWLMEYLQALKVDCERIEVAPGRANVLARFEVGATRTLLLDAHQDTVPAEGMTIAPFVPKISDGRMYGRGAADVKGGLAAMLHAFTRLVKERPAGAANVVLSCTCDEESTILGIRDLVTYWESAKGKSRLLSSCPDAAIVAEPTDLDVVIAHRGVTRFRVHTLGRACHSSDPSLGRNAIYLMAKAIAHLEHVASVLPKFLPPHPLCGQPTLSVGRIYGGQSVNIVPDRCTIEIDRRLVPGEDPLVVWEKLKEDFILRFGEFVEVEPAWISCPALGNHNNAELSAMLLECIQEVAGKHCTKGVLYGTHASTLCGANVPAVVFGPGSIQQAHTQDEFIDLVELDQAAEIYYRAALKQLSK